MLGARSAKLNESDTHTYISGWTLSFSRFSFLPYQHLPSPRESQWQESAYANWIELTWNWMYWNNQGPTQTILDPRVEKERRALIPSTCQAKGRNWSTTFSFCMQFPEKWLNGRELSTKWKIFTGARGCIDTCNNNRWSRKIRHWKGGYDILATCSTSLSSTCLGKLISLDIQHAADQLTGYLQRWTDSFVKRT